MGYSTEFEGQFVIDPPSLTPEHLQVLRDFASEVHDIPLWGYCQWVPNLDGTALEWDGNEKFYDYINWLKYLIATFLKPWGYNLNGEVEWFGESGDDRGKLVLKDSELTVFRGVVKMEETVEWTESAS